jgi:Tol biopolymer transport system component
MNPMKPSAFHEMRRNPSIPGNMIKFAVMLSGLMTAIVFITWAWGQTNPVFLLRLAVSTARGIPQYYVVDNHSDIMIKDPQPFSYSPPPITSPDGKWKAYVEELSAENSLYIVPTAGGESLLLEHNLSLVGWSHDSELLAYSTFPALVISSRDGSERRIRSENIAKLSLSPDGRWFALQLALNEGRYYAVMPFTMDAEPVMIPQLPAEPTTYEMVWSPDSRYLILTSNQSNQLNDLYVVEPGSDLTPRRLTDTFESSEWTPQWSPDGRYLAMKESLPHEQVYQWRMTLIDFVTGQRQSWTSEKTDNILYSNAWSPDGKWLAFKYEFTLMLYETATGQAHALGDFPQIYNSNLLWSADSNWLAFACNPPSDSPVRAGVYALHIPDMQLSYVAKTGIPSDWYPAFDALLEAFDEPETTA